MPAYSAMFPTPSHAAVGPPPWYRLANPAAPHAAANATAAVRVVRPVGSGLLMVLFMRASFSTSNTWLSVFALAAQSMVPSPAYAIPAYSMTSPLPSAYPTHVVETTSALRRVFASWCATRSAFLTGDDGDDGVAAAAFAFVIVCCVVCVPNVLFQENARIFDVENADFC